MTTQQPRITVRRTVPFDLTGAEVSERFEVGVGERVQLGEQSWTVEQIVHGDRGSVVLVGAG